MMGFWLIFLGVTVLFLGISAKFLGFPGIVKKRRQNEVTFTGVEMLQIFVVYVLLCIIWSAVFIVRRFDTIRQDMMRPEHPYSLFMVGIIFVVLSSPIWIPKAIYNAVSNVIREIRDIKV